MLAITKDGEAVNNVDKTDVRETLIVTLRAADAEGESEAPPELVADCDSDTESVTDALNVTVGEKDREADGDAVCEEDIDEKTVAV